MENPDIGINAKDYFSNTDAGVRVIAGVNVNKMVIGFRYTAELTNVVSDETTRMSRRTVFLPWL